MLYLCSTEKEYHMLTKDKVLALLSEAVHGTDKVWYTDDEMNAFAKYFMKEKAVFVDKLCGNLVDFIITSFIEYSDSIGEPCRHCTVCGKFFREGYCFNHGEAYYCSDECLHRDFTEEEWKKECKEDDQSYYTEWF